MRTIDTAKRDKVVQTVLQITMEEGLAALSFDKLAKRAGISSGTPYVYYKDKTDMLSCIYTQVWQGLQEGLQQAIDMGRTPGEKLFFGLRQLAQTLLAHPQRGPLLPVGDQRAGIRHRRRPAGEQPALAAAAGGVSGDHRPEADED